MYENKALPPLPRHRFLRRLSLHFAVATAVVIVSLVIGMIGYMHFEDLAWEDGFLNAAMLLSGMGPVHRPETYYGKLFAGFYALFGGLVFVVAAGVVVAPIVHRLLHKFHWNT